MKQPRSILGFAEARNGWQQVLPYLLLASTVFAVYSASLYFGFVWDDDAYVIQNYRIQALAWVRLRTVWNWNNFYVGLWNPLQHTFLAVVYRFAGLEPFGFHLAQILLHAACVCLAYVVVRKMESARVALLASLLFAVHPANVEVVAWITETKSTLAFLFFLASFWAFIRFRETNRWGNGIVCGFLLVLSLLSKISTVVAPAIFVLYDYREGRRFRKSHIWSLAAYFFISAVFTVIHLRGTLGSGSSDFQNYGGSGVHLLNVPLVLAFYLRLMIFPVHLSAWELFPAQFRFTATTGLAWIGLLGLFWVIYRSPRRQQFWELWFFVFLLPVSQIVPFPIWVGDRYLYAAAIGGFVLFSQAIFWLQERFAEASLAGNSKLPVIGGLTFEIAAIAIVLLLGWRAERQLPVWRDDLSLWEGTLPNCPTSAYCHVNLGQALITDGQIQRGAEELIRGVELRPAPRYLADLGDAFAINARDYEQAIRVYQLALKTVKAWSGGNDEVLPSPQLYAKLARAYFWAGELDRADQTVRDGERVSRFDPSLLVTKGFVMWKEGRPDDARTALRTALIVTGTNSNIAGFFSGYWQNPAEVGQLLADLRAEAASKNTVSQKQ